MAGTTCLHAKVTQVSMTKLDLDVPALIVMTSVAKIAKGEMIVGITL
jgi:hypothetical protein